METNSENIGINSTIEIISNYELLEKEYIKNKINEINENIKQTLTQIRWIIGICGASLAFIIGNYNNTFNTYQEIQDIFLIFALLIINYIFILESKYISFCNIKQKFYNAIKKNDTETIYNVLFTVVENKTVYTLSTFPLVTFIFLFFCSFGIYGIRYNKTVQFTFNNNETLINNFLSFMDCIRFYNDETILNNICYFIFIITIFQPIIFTMNCLYYFLLNKIKKYILS